jgi:hypothetical protein
MCCFACGELREIERSNSSGIGFGREGGEAHQQAGFEFFSLWPCTFYNHRELFPIARLKGKIDFEYEVDWVVPCL